MNPIEIIDKTFIDDKALLRLAMLIKKTMLMAEDDEQCSDLKDRTI